jgi:hypothetical protein
MIGANAPVEGAVRDELERAAAGDRRSRPWRRRRAPASPLIRQPQPGTRTAAIAYARAGDPLADRTCAFAQSRASGCRCRRDCFHPPAASLPAIALATTRWPVAGPGAMTSDDRFEASARQLARDCFAGLRSRRPASAGKSAQWGGARAGLCFGSGRRAQLAVASACERESANRRCLHGSS